MNQIIVDGFVNNFRTGVTDSGSTWANFTVANSTYAGKNEDGTARYAKSWFDVSTWDGLAEKCAATLDTDEPRLVQVMGEIVQREYENKDGITVKTFRIKAREVTRSGNLSQFNSEGGSSAPEMTPRQPAEASF